MKTCIIHHNKRIFLDIRNKLIFKPEIKYFGIHGAFMPSLEK